VRGRGVKRTSLALACALVIALLSSLSASGHPGHGKHVIQVRPGPNAITKALRKADAGDKLRIHRGRYRESIEVTKPVEIVGAGGGRRPVIDGQCKTEITVGVAASGVALEHLKVIGATDLAGAGRAVDFRAANGRMEDLRLRDTCDAEYGINVVESGAVSVLGSRARGFSDAGIYVGQITDTGGGTLLVSGNEARNNNKGIIVEASVGGDIAVVGNDVHNNDLPGLGEQTGIFVNRSQGVLIANNSVRSNGSLGIHLTVDASGNVLNDNQVTGNPTDLRDEGAGNCGSGNTFSTGGSLPAC
jgi:parallel beta-helix repeat protein